MTSFTPTSFLDIGSKDNISRLIRVKQYFSSSNVMDVGWNFKKKINRIFHFSLFHYFWHFQYKTSEGSDLNNCECLIDFYVTIVGNECLILFSLGWNEHFHSQSVGWKLIY